ncbi:MAG: hypothetical protein MJY48_00955 [Bacteroidales bacterium]|nr:hypothetical protein [Bacteroidales bacterium]
MLEGLHENIGRLIALYETQKQRNAELTQALQENRQALDSCKKQITELNRQIDNLKLTSAFMGSGDSTVAKERINKLIAEIDKCIRLLQK